MSAASKVFAVPELLEHVLSHLPPKDALLAQRTSTTFRDTIRDSPKLQNYLGFKQPFKPPLDKWNRLLIKEHPGHMRRPRYFLHLPGIDEIEVTNNLRPNVLFYDIDVTRVRDLLKTRKKASCLDMYIQQADSEQGHRIVVKQYIFVGEGDERVFKGCYAAEVIVRVTTLRNVLLLAIALTEATEELGRVAMQTTQAKGKSLADVCGPAVASKESLGTELGGLVLEEPKCRPCDIDMPA